MSCFDATTSQDEGSYDGDVSDVDGEDAQVIPDEPEETMAEATVENQLEAPRHAGSD